MATAATIKERIYVIYTDYATFALIADWYDDKIKAAAPIANWTIGKLIIDVLRYYITKKGARVEMYFISAPLQ